jgi:hypothetical protein
MQVRLWSRRWPFIKLARMQKRRTHEARPCRELCTGPLTILLTVLEHPQPTAIL